MFQEKTVKVDYYTQLRGMQPIIRETYAFIRESYALIREKYNFFLYKMSPIGFRTIALYLIY